MRRVSENPTSLAHRRKCLAQLGLIGAKPRDCHRPSNQQSVHRRESPSLSFHFVKVESALGLLPRRIHLHQNLDGSLAIFAKSVDRIGQPRAVQGVEQ